MRIMPGYRFASIVACGVLLALLVGALAPAATHAQERTTVYTVLRATPSIIVARGGELSYTIDVRNPGRHDANYVRVRLSYDPAQVEVTGATFEDDDDFVTTTESEDATRSQIEIQFTDLDPEEERSAVVTMQVDDMLDDGDVIQVFGSFYWADGSGERVRRQTNAVPVLVANSNVDSEFVWMVAEPAAVAQGGEIVFLSNRFLPKEEMVFWMNLPNGEVMAVDKQTAVEEESGIFRLRYDTSDLPPGDYQMVGYGTNSRLTGFADFTVTP